MYIVRFKNLNSQAALGNGRQTKSTTGIGNEKGMYSADEAKCFGIEDLWGSISDCIDGALFYNGVLYTAFKNFSDSTTGYTNQGKLFDSNITSNNYIVSVQGTSEKGFFSKNFGGSNTSYYADSVRIVIGSQCLLYGGATSDSSNGIFKIEVPLAYSSSADIVVGTRLMYL
jgi:hypothetical protein